MNYLYYSVNYHLYLEEIYYDYDFMNYDYDMLIMIIID